MEISLVFLSILLHPATVQFLRDVWHAIRKTSTTLIGNNSDRKVLFANKFTFSSFDYTWLTLLPPATICPSNMALQLAHSLSSGHDTLVTQQPASSGNRWDCSHTRRAPSDYYDRNCARMEKRGFSLHLNFHLRSAEDIYKERNSIEATLPLCYPPKWPIIAPEGVT